MTRSDLRNKVKYDVPEIVDAWPDSTDTDTNIDNELNRAALEIAYHTCCIAGDNTEELTADTETFALQSDFLRMDPEGGVWYLDSDSDWQRVKPKSMAWLDENKPTWRNADSSDPDYCFIRGNNLHIYPKSDTTTSNGLRYYYGKQPTSMSGDSIEPFNNLPWLDQFHPLVALRVEIEAKKAKTKYTDAQQLQAEYVARLQDMTNFVRGRRLEYFSPDFIQNMKGYKKHFKR